MAKYTIRHDKNEPRGRFRGDGKFALGIVIGVFGAILAFVSFEFFWGTPDFSEYLLTVPLIISLIVALASTYIAVNALLEQRKAREAGTDPVLIAHLGQRVDARELVTFNISNVGSGAAIKVQLVTERPVDNDNDWKKRNFLQNIFRPHKPFAVIPQGQSVEFNFALGWNLLGQDLSNDSNDELPSRPLPPFQAKLSYEDLAGAQYDGEFTIDVREMEGLGAHKSPQMRIVAALEMIEKKNK